MLNAILVAVHFVILAFSGHKQVALENAVLRQQLAVFKRDVKRPKLLGRGSPVLDRAKDDVAVAEGRAPSCALCAIVPGGRIVQIREASNWPCETG